jgi:biopolymer transport protein ExbB
MKALGDFFWHEWYFAIPLVLMSLTAVTLVVWRALLNWNAGTNLAAFLPALQTKLDREGVEGALKLCKQQPQSELIPRVLFVAGLEQAKQGSAAMRRAMANVIELDILPRLNFLLAPILAIAKIATMLGLLGTVISMIKTFSKMQETLSQSGGGAGGGGSAAYAGAIGLALFATALGLVTAIPLVFAHVLFKDWIAGFETRMKGAAQKLVLMAQSAKPTGDKAKPAAETSSTGNKPAAASAAPAANARK